MEPDHTENRPENTHTVSEPTLDGRRLGLNELNLGQIKGRGKFKQCLRHLSQFLAGMYTGESCAGTPRGERKSVQTPRSHEHQ
ncbi:MAG: hypothetical protein WD071_16285 [Pseudohongiella sp.]|uniref:hypothetical protein n=1 Tax=Pseudohongiella sp. TaxID=1979412 RepID=UPI0034A06578